MARAARRRQTGSATRRTTRQQSGRRTQHLLWLLGGAFLLAIASLLALAYYRESIAPWRAAVVRVDQQVVDMAQYVRRLRLAKAESELRGQVFNPSVEPMATLAALQEEAMLLLWASQDGVIAEGAAVDAELQRWLAAQVGVEPGADGQFEAADAARIEARYSTLRTETGLDRADFQRLAKASVLRQGLRQKLAESVPTEAPQAQVEVMVAGSRETAQQALQRLGDGEEWAAVAQALQGSGTAPQGLSIQEWLPQGVVGEDFDRVVFGLPPGQASQPVPVSSGFLVVRVDERQEDRSLPGGGAAAQVHASIIAVADEEAAQQVTQRLGAGEAFDSLAREMSLDVGSREAGGDIGWVPRGVRGPEFDRLAFGLDIGERGGPVGSAEFWYVVRVLERSPMWPLDDAVREVMLDQALSEWFAARRQSNRVESYLDSTRYQFAMQQL